MFPRRSSLLRIVGVIAFIFYVGYVWVSTPVDRTEPGFEHLPAFPPGGAGKEDDAPGRKSLREGTPMHRGGESANLSVKAPPVRAVEVDPVHKHAHANNTLESMRKNMTLLKVNMSGLADIVHSANRSQGIFFHKSWDDPNVPHPHPFKYIINSRSICRDPDIFLLIYVHTATGNYKRRMVIRQTWGNPKYYPDINVRLVFVCGKSDDKPEEQSALDFEAEQYGDIVQEDFKDSYKNLTYKGVAALKWISLHCSHAKFILKTDDDIFVNMFTLLRHLQSMDRHGVDNRGLLMCLVWNNMKVMREGKWAISKTEWPEDHYPTYCSGSAFTMSTDVAVALHNVSYQVPFFWVDDFYITGLLPLKLGNIKHKQFMSTYVLDGTKLEEKFTGPQWFTYIFSHVHNLNSIQSVWKKLVRLSSGQDRAEVKFALPGELKKLGEVAQQKELEKEEEKKKKQEAEKSAKKSWWLCCFLCVSIRKSQFFNFMIS